MTDRRASTFGITVRRRPRISELLRNLFFDGPGLPGIFFAAGALGFGIGSILMANLLDPADFGVVALFLVFLRIGIALGPLGLDMQLLRARPERDLVPFGLVLASCLCATIFTVITVAALYDLASILLIALSVGLISAAYWRMFVVLLQSRGKKTKALCLSQSPNLVTLALGLAAWLVGIKSPYTLCALGAAGYVIAASIGWSVSGARNWNAADRQLDQWNWADRLGLAGLATLALFVGQVERFLIPEVLSLEDLGIYAAVSSLAVAPLKILTAVSKFYLIPLVAAADNSGELLSVIRRQGAALAVLALVFCLAVLAISPWLWHRILPETYEIETYLVLAVLAIGMVRLYVAIANTLIQVGSGTRGLFISNAGVCICLGVASLVAVFFSPAELTDIIWIVVAGIASYGLCATVIVIHTVRNMRSAPIAVT